MATGSDAAVEEGSATRRRFFSYVGWGSFIAFWGGCTLASLRFLFPRVLYEPSLRFFAGKPEDYTVGEVSTRMKKEQRVWIVRNEEGMYALISNCTHLGCTPIWWPAEDRIKCPCHGSNFTKDGDVKAGPAPRPLERAAISLDLAGNIVVDKSQKLVTPNNVIPDTEEEKKLTEERKKPPFFLPLKA
jgi:cytochrome b6-f complex iron-sulfur subunit